MVPPENITHDTLQSLSQRCSALDKRHSELFSTGRPLRYDERSRLTEQGNWCEDWKAIRVAAGFIPDHIRDSRFSGSCYLGVFTGTPLGTHDGVPFTSGLYNSHIRNSLLDDECSVVSCSTVNNYHIASGALLYDCGTVSATGASTFGNDTTAVIGNETGGRDVPVFAEMTFTDAIEATADPLRRSVLRETAGIRSSGATALRYGIIDENAILRGCGAVIDVIIGVSAHINGASRIENCTILSEQSEKTSIGTGVILRTSCVQWGCSVDSMAIVDHSLLCEHSHVERHGKVTNSIIGPNTGIAEGEVTSSLVGPFVGFHHQALCIGTIWPEGKGNIGYGANVGSNHTGKAPDQELYSGEGFFYGLGVNIKFPADFSAAPYSMVATGVTTLPQRMTFPFSLINTPSRTVPGLSPAINELLPAWVLSDNLYLVKRNEAKFAKRNSAVRTAIPVSVFRPAIIDHMVSALGRLESAPKDKNVFTDADIAGIGKNFVTAESITAAIGSYRLHIEHYCLTGLYRYLRESSGNRVALIDTSLFDTEAADTAWEHCRTTYRTLGGHFTTPSEHLDRLIAMEKQLLRSVIDSKEKDAVRGRRIMNDYDLSHTPAAQERFIIELQESFEKLQADIEDLKTACVIQ